MRKEALRARTHIVPALQLLFLPTSKRHERPRFGPATFGERLLKKIRMNENIAVGFLELHHVVNNINIDSQYGQYSDEGLAKAILSLEKEYLAVFKAARACLAPTESDQTSVTPAEEGDSSPQSGEGNPLASADEDFFV